MIIVRLIGGLGNQMFQYATGRALASHHAVPLKLDIRSLIGGDINGRMYELDRFRIRAEIATQEECDSLCCEQPSTFHRLIGGWIKRFKPPMKHAKTYLHEVIPFKWDPRLGSCIPPVYLDGYWQSYRYFDDFRQQILQDLSPDPALEFPLHILDQLKSPTSVGVHFRRKDYVTNSKVNREIGTCPIDYYLRAFKFIESRIKDVTYFAFTDDPEWVKDTLGQYTPLTVVSGQYTQSGVEDLHLLSMCSHQIIANSSFSWWGAFLNSNRDKIVIYPTEWWISKKWDIPDLCPPDWFPISMRND